MCVHYVDTSLIRARAVDEREYLMIIEGRFFLFRTETIVATDFFCVPQGPFMGPCTDAKYPNFFPI